MTQNCVSFFFCELVGISFNTAGGHWDDSLNTPLHLFGDSELLSNSPNLAQEHKKIGPSQQETTFLNTLLVLNSSMIVCSNRGVWVSMWGWFFKHTIASLWKFGVAVKLGKLGTRAHKKRPKPARDYFCFWKQTLDTFCYLKCPISTRKFLLI